MKTLPPARSNSGLGKTRAAAVTGLTSPVLDAECFWRLVRLARRVVHWHTFNPFGFGPSISGTIALKDQPFPDRSHFVYLSSIVSVAPKFFSMSLPRLRR
jgi:hypothetical protein